MISSYFYCTSNTLNYTKTHTWRMQHRDKHKQAHTHTRTHKRAAVYVCVCGRDRDRAGETGDKGGLVVARAVAVVCRTYPLSSNMEPRRTLRR